MWTLMLIDSCLGSLTRRVKSGSLLVSLPTSHTAQDIGGRWAARYKYSYQVATVLVARGCIAAATLWIRLHTSSMLTASKSGRVSPQICSFFWGILAPLWFLWPIQVPKQHLDWLLRFCKAHGCDQQVDRHTHQHTDHATSVVKSHFLGHLPASIETIRKKQMSGSRCCLAWTMYLY